jgi:capsular exopolysaccharide synthesis family protein
MINFSELLWKSGSLTDKQALSSVGEDSEDLGRGSPVPRVPVDEVQIPPESRIVLLTNPRSPGADRFRFLRMRLRELKEVAKLRSLVVTSPLPQDGKSTIAANLATALAEGGERSVLLVEADLHCPSMARRLGIQSRPGLAECLDGRLDPLMALRRLEPLHWHLLQAGEPQTNPTKLLQSDALPSVLQKLSSYFDWIVIDTPPLVPLSDAVLVSRQTDASLLVVRADSTPRETIEESLNLLGQKHVLGIVFNGAEELNRLYSKYDSYYGKK